MLFYVVIQVSKSAIVIIQILLLSLTYTVLLTISPLDNGNSEFMHKLLIHNHTYHVICLVG